MIFLMLALLQSPPAWHTNFPRLVLYTQARDNPSEVPSGINVPGAYNNYADPHASDIARWDLIVLDANYAFDPPGATTPWYPGLVSAIKTANPGALVVFNWEVSQFYGQVPAACVTTNDIPWHRDVIADARWSAETACCPAAGDCVAVGTGQPVQCGGVAGVAAYAVRCTTTCAHGRRFAGTFPAPGVNLWIPSPVKHVAGSPPWSEPGQTGMIYRNFVVARVGEEFTANPLYDGFMWDAIENRAPDGADLDRDGVEDTSSDSSTRWWGIDPDTTEATGTTYGWAKAMRDVNAAFPSRISIAQFGFSNISPIPLASGAREEIQGDITPAFPRPYWFGGGQSGNDDDSNEYADWWREAINYAEEWKAQGRAPQLPGWFSGGKGWQTVTNSSIANYRRMRYTLASGCLTGAYVGFDGGDTGHHQRWWYDEYDLCGLQRGWLGAPLDVARAIGSTIVTAFSPLLPATPGPIVWNDRELCSTLWFRAFENGVVILNIGSEIRTSATAVTPADTFTIPAINETVDVCYTGLANFVLSASPQMTSPYTQGINYTVNLAAGTWTNLTIVPGPGVSRLYATFDVTGGTSLSVANIGYARILGSQDPVTNNGSIDTTITVPRTDGLFLVEVPTDQDVPIQRSLIVDNGDAGYTDSGSWDTRGENSQAELITGGGANRYDVDFRTASNSSTNVAEWSRSLSHSGKWEVSVWSPHEGQLNNGQNASAEPYTVVHSLGSTTVTIDKTASQHQWTVLGTFDFVKGTPALVRLQGNGGAGILIADAVRFRWIG